MKLSKQQIERLQRSAKHPGRPVAAAEPVAAVGVHETAGAAAVIEWQAASCAPFDRDLEVRLSDGIGRYSLLYPCRLVANKGWVNALSGTPLTGDPVEWRDWQQRANDLR